MVFEWVAVEVLEDEKGKVTRTIVDEGKVDAKNREYAFLKIGMHLGWSIDDNWEISVRPFLNEQPIRASPVFEDMMKNVVGKQTYSTSATTPWNRSFHREI